MGISNDDRNTIYIKNLQKVPKVLFGQKFTALNAFKKRTWLKSNELIVQLKGQKKNKDIGESIK